MKAQNHWVSVTKIGTKRFILQVICVYTYVG
jgi:hypothetical protein